MSEEENKAIALLNELLLQRNENKIVINTFDLFENIEIVLKLIGKQQKEFEELREVIEKYYIDKDKIKKRLDDEIEHCDNICIKCSFGDKFCKELLENRQCTTRLN